MKCKIHPDYRATKKPDNTCENCWKMFLFGFNQQWYQSPKLVALVMLWRFTLNMGWSEIVDKLFKYGVIVKPNTLKNYVHSLGVLTELSSFYSNDIYKTINKTLNINEKVKIPPKKTSGKTQLHLITSDYHAPFYRSDMIKHIIQNYKHVDSLIINGDFFDQYSISRFIQYKNIPLIEEFKLSIELMRILSENFRKIVLISGNHDQRIWKHFINKGIGIDLMFLVKYNWCAHMAELFPNIEIANSVVGNKNAGTQNMSHCYLLGKDCVVGHFEFIGSGNLDTAEKMEKWLYEWRTYLPELNKAKLFLAGHSHRISKATIHAGEKTIGETGCFCSIQEYAIKSDAKWKPSTNGWWEVYQEDGITNINKSNYILWEEK